MFQTVSLLILLVSLNVSAQTQDPKKPAIEMFMESPERFQTLKAILDRSFLRDDSHGSGSGVYIGTNDDNIGLILSAAHVVRQRLTGREEKIIPEVDGIPRSDERPEVPLHLKEYLFGRYFLDPAKPLPRITVPFYSPSFDFTDSNFIWEDFALALVGNTVDSYGSVTSHFTNPSNQNPAPSLQPLVVAAPVYGEDLISIGGLRTDPNYDLMLEAFEKGSKEEIRNATAKFKEHYSFSKVADYETGWSIFNKNTPDKDFDPEVEFYMQGDVANVGMSGGGIYNLKGQLVGLITHVLYFDGTSKTKYVRAIRADYIIKSIRAKSQNPEVLKSLEASGLSLTCEAYL